MKQTKKSAESKPAPKKAVKPAPAPAPAPKKAPVAKKPAPAAKKPAAPKKEAPVAAPAAQPAPAPISPETRYKMIQDAAYFIAERHGFQGDSAYFWSLAEAEIKAQLGE